MKKHGVLAVKLTADLGLAHGAVTEWKKGKAKPGTDAIIKIAEYFGVTTDYLLKGAEPQLRLIKNEKGNGTMNMNDKAREYLDKLRDMFRLFLDKPMNVSAKFNTIKIQIETSDDLLNAFDGNLDAIDKHKKTEFEMDVTDEKDAKKISEMMNSDKFQAKSAALKSPGNIEERYSFFNVTKEILKEWVEGNYDTSPPTARQLIPMLIHSVTPDLGEESEQYANRKSAINDYLFYTNLTSNQIRVLNEMKRFETETNQLNFIIEVSKLADRMATEFAEEFLNRV
jgi:transcriptional regulator with XRE-family HTH domain